MSSLLATPGLLSRAGMFLAGFKASPDLPNSRRRAFFFTASVASRSTSELRGSCTGLRLRAPSTLISEEVLLHEASTEWGTVAIAHGI
jgi:hypothetical protein